MEAPTRSDVGRARPRPFLVYTVVVSLVAAAITVSQLGQIADTAGTQPRFWLLAAVAVLVGWQALVTPRPGGAWIVLSPTVCFTFAILLCWGLGPAIVAQMAAVLAVAWRVRQAPLDAAASAAEFILAFAAAYVVVYVGDPDPFGKHGPVNVLGDALTVVGAAVAWLLAFGVLLAISAWLRRGHLPAQVATGTVGYRILFKAALLLLSPVMAVTAHVNIAFVPLVFVPLYAVQRMARLSNERERAAHLDPLTGLANRAGLKARFDDLATWARRRPADIAGRRLALLVLDLDRFKHVNDALGHDVGDQLLVAVANRLAAAEADDGVVARFGGDEFAILAPVHDGEDAHRFAGHVMAALTDPVTLDGLSMDVTASIGIAVHPDHGEDFPTLMRHADVAMYEAKKRGDSVALYEPCADHNTPQRLGLLTDFRQALETNDRDQIALLFQPQVSLDNGEVVGVEALLRWQHPRYGPIPTLDLLQVAEHTSVMHMLTSYVIDEVLAQVAAWDADGISLRASLNVSARDLYSGDIVCYLSGQLARHHVSPDQVQLEITESAHMADPTRALATTSRLADLGVAIALDDFGTGYSSLQHLRKLPLSELKIDRSFVAGMAHNADDATIVASTVEMARAMGLRTVAEGVENEQTRQLLADLGCSLAQGWLTARPMPADQIPTWLADHRVAPGQASAHSPPRRRQPAATRLAIGDVGLARVR